MKRCFVPKQFSKSHNIVIDRANALLEEYARHGIDITLRSLYYRFVANNWLKNKQKEYKRLGSIIGDARLAGRIDWDHLIDRTRRLSSLQHFDGPDDALSKLANWYHVDMWANQKFRPEVWVEKDAVVGNIQAVCEENDIPFFSCRGYTSLTEMYNSGCRLRRWLQQDQQPFIIHFGDHDPSGIDMSRDIMTRLQKTFLADCQFQRVALNMEQIEEYKPPPNFAKITDSRWKAYVAEYGEDSWELDALDPLKFRDLIEEQLKSFRDEKQWKKDLAEESAVQKKLVHIAHTWDNPRYPTSSKEALAEIKKWKLSQEEMERVQKGLPKPKRRKRK